MLFYLAHFYELLIFYKTLSSNVLFKPRNAFYLSTLSSVLRYDLDGQDGSKYHQVWKG